MSWKDDLRDVSAMSKQNFHRLAAMEKRQEVMNTKLDLIQRLVQDQVAKMADRVIEMAMVQQGGLSDANSHRRVAGLDDKIPEATEDIWADEKDDWPPPGCAALEMP